MAQKMIDQTDKEAEYYRSMVVSQSEHIELLKQNVNELQGQLQLSYRRIAELREALETEVEENRNEPEIVIDRTIFPAV